MTDDLSTEALAYLLNELDPRSRLEFEKRLAHDPVAVARLKACADSVALYALAQAPEAALEERERAAMMTVVTGAAATGASRRGAAWWWRYGWPAAAAALLVLNIGQWAYHAHIRNRWQMPGMGAEDDRSAETKEAPPAGGFGPGTSQKPGVAPNVVPGDSGREVARELARLASLRLEYARLQGSRDALKSEYRQILQQLAVQAVTSQASGRLVAMELVDGASYASGNRSGLMDMSGTILTKPGVVAAGPPINTNPQPQNTPSVPNVPSLPSGSSTVAAGSTTAVSGSVTSSSTLVGVATATLDSIAPVSVTLPSSTPASTPNTGSSQPATTQGSTGANDSTTPSSSSTAPYAVSLFDQGQNQGYLDLYNLPTVPSDRSLQLWVQPTGSETFQNVGEIPSQFYGESGGVYYKLPAGTATPSQIMITIEPRATVPVAPTGAVVLRGP